MDSQTLHSETDESRFVVYLRFPFFRNGFEDPVPCEWNDDKERELRECISSRALQRGDIDWDTLASRFDVSVPFILQQAIWVYERELEHVRGQMLKVNKTVYNQKPSGTSSHAVDSLVKQSGQGSRERASSSFSPRRRLTDEGATIRNTSSLRQAVASGDLQESPRAGSGSSPLEGSASLPFKSDESGSSSLGESSSRRLLSTSRTFKPPSSKLRESATLAAAAATGTPSDRRRLDSSDHSFEDDLDEELYDAFLPVDFKPPAAAANESVSFSDLSDTSVSKSALEEALLSDYRQLDIH